MEIVVTQGSFATRAVVVEPTQRKAWLCEEYANVGLETEGRVNHWVASTEQVIGMFVTMIVKDVLERENRVNQVGAD